MEHNYNWQAKRAKNAFLALEDGTVLYGYAVGARVDKVGEVVFNTGLSGYQEILSDPSYSGQFVTMTYPEIGNIGINEEDMESRKFFLSGFVMHQMNEPSNWRCDVSLEQRLIDEGVPGIAGIDTRALTVKLREIGTLKGFLHCSEDNISEEDAIQKAKEWCGLDGQDYAAKVTTPEIYTWDEDDASVNTWGVLHGRDLPPVTMNVVAYDFGVKWNILRNLRVQGMNVTVVPANTPASEVLAMKPDGVFFSNGPADPSAVSYAIEAAKELIGKLPIMGICLGHQILSLACGANTFRLKFGHHGCNHPVKNLATGEVEITSQNHNYAVALDSLPECLEATHMNLNDNTVEGIKHKTAPMFAVQYHPEAAPGPHDPEYLFEQFADMIKNA